jgi:hypothetical protein
MPRQRPNSVPRRNDAMRQNQKSSTAWVMFRQFSGCRRFDPVTAYQRRSGASCARIKHRVTRRSQYNMHLLSFVPAPGLAHLPTQFAALSSHRGASNTARAGELRSAPMPMRVIAKKMCRAMFEPPETGERATLNPNLSTRLILLFSDQALGRRVGYWRSRRASGAVSPFFEVARQTGVGFTLSEQPYARTPSPRSGSQPSRIDKARLAAV